MLSIFNWWHLYCRLQWPSNNHRFHRFYWGFIIYHYLFWSEFWSRYRANGKPIWLEYCNRRIQYCIFLNMHINGWGDNRKLKWGAIRNYTGNFKWARRWLEKSKTCSFWEFVASIYRLAIRYRWIWNGIWWHKCMDYSFFRRGLRRVPFYNRWRQKMDGHGHEWSLRIFFKFKKRGRIKFLHVWGA